MKQSFIYLVYLAHIFWHPLISTVMPFHHIYISFRSESYHITSLAIISPPKGLGITLLLLLMNIPSHPIINMNKDKFYNIDSISARKVVAGDQIR